MPKLPIRSVIERALEKGGDLDDFIAVPMLFESEKKRLRGGTEYIRTTGPHAIYYPLPDVDVRRVWYTVRTIELDLNNGMHVSIETKPLTLAMHLTTVPENEGV